MFVHVSHIKLALFAYLCQSLSQKQSLKTEVNRELNGCSDFHGQCLDYDLFLLLLTAVAETVSIVPLT